MCFVGLIMACTSFTSDNICIFEYVLLIVLVIFAMLCVFCFLCVWIARIGNFADEVLCVVDVQNII